MKKIFNLSALILMLSLAACAPSEVDDIFDDSPAVRLDNAIKNYTERDLKGMREVITSGGRIDSIINMQPQDLLIQKGQQQTLTNPQLAQYIERQKQRGFANIQAFEVEYYQRGASSFAAFILTAIGLSLSAKKRKNGMGISLGIGLLLSFAYIMFQTISATFAIQANFPPMLAVWIPNIVFMFIAVYCYKFAPK